MISPKIALLRAVFDLTRSEFSKLSHLRNVVAHQHAKFRDDQYMCGWVTDDQPKLLHLFLRGALKIKWHRCFEKGTLKNRTVMASLIQCTHCHQSLPICTKFGGDVVWSSLHTKLKNGADISLQWLKVETRKAKRPKIAHLPPWKLGEGWRRYLCTLK